GYVFDLKKLSKIVSREILQKVDHKCLNELDLFKNTIPTTENMAKIFWNLLKPKLRSKNACLYSIRLYETEKNIIEYKE
ncbi:MAG: 6-carboxytetrahydropterin synthase, partial [Ignavibacteria bacterium]